MENLSSIATPRPSLPSAFNLLKQALSFYSEHWKVVLGITVIPFVFDLATQAVYQKATGAGIILGLISLIIYFLAMAALLTFLVKNQSGVVNTYNNGLRMIVPFAWISILGPLAILGGFFLLVIPGILLLVWLSLSSYVLFAEDERGTSALVQSWYYVRGYWGQVLWRLAFIFLLFVILSLILVLLISLITGISIFTEPEVATPLWVTLIILILTDLVILPIGLIYGYGIYRSLKEAKASVVFSPEESSKLRKWVTAFLIVGLIGSVILFLLFIVLISLFALSLAS